MLMSILKVVMIVFFCKINAFSIKKNEADSDDLPVDAFENQHVVLKNTGEVKQRHKRNCKVNPFDVYCHYRCPKYEDEWKSLQTYHNCSSKRQGATYHCTEDSDGKIVDACGIPKPCDKGKGVVIKFPPGHTMIADIECEWCPEGWFNPEESKMSDTFYICPKMKETCKEYGVVKCDEATGVERHWTDSKCECDIKNNFFPFYNKQNNCTYHMPSCTKKMECSKSADGFDQVYKFTSNGYECQPGCEDGFEFKTTKECETIGVDEHGGHNNGSSFEITTAGIINSSSPVTNTSSDTSTTTMKPEGTPSNNQKANGSSSKKVIIYSAGAIIAVLIAVLIAVCYVGFCVYCIIGRRDDGRGQYDSINGISRPYIVFCWPCYYCRGHTSTGNSHEMVRLGPGPSSAGISPPDRASNAQEPVSSSAGSSSTGQETNELGKRRWIYELPQELQQKCLNDIKPHRLPGFISDGWNQIALEVGLSHTAIDHIKADCNREYDRIQNVINKYIQDNEDATVLNFLKILEKCQDSTKIEWKDLKKYIMSEYNKK